MEIKAVGPGLTLTFPAWALRLDLIASLLRANVNDEAQPQTKQNLQSFDSSFSTAEPLCLRFLTQKAERTIEPSSPGPGEDSAGCPPPCTHQGLAKWSVSGQCAILLLVKSRPGV